MNGNAEFVNYVKLKKKSKEREVKMINYRPEVLKFAEAMELQLQANEYKGGWKDCSSKFLLSELQKNYNSLGELLPSDKKNVLRRTANIANFAMMIANNWGGLAEEENAKEVE